jgi:archaellum component FlaG (FlaF/FlaG flagellin family)
LKAIIVIFILAVLAAGSVAAEEKVASPSATSVTAKAVSMTDQVDQIFERAIDERIIDRLGLFDRSDDGSARYGISLDLENEDGDWNFEVTVTMEF